MKRSGFSHINVTNFQSVSEADAPLGPLTVVVGDNTAGKSALLRAIEAACFNQNGTDFITWGENTTEVVLTLTADGRDTNRLAWRKGRVSSATYDLDTHEDTQHFSKLGAAVPKEVRDALRIAAIEVDKTLTLTPQIHRQGEFAFLIDRGEGQAARALAKMTKLDVVVEAQGLIRRALRACNTELKAVGDNIESYEDQMAEFAGLDAELDLLERVQPQVALIEQRAATITQQKRAAHQYDDIAHNFALMPDTSTIAVEDIMAQYEAVEVRRVALDAWSRASTALIDEPVVFHFNVQVENISIMHAAQKQWERARLDLDAVQVEINGNEMDYDLRVREYNALDVCPECGQPLPVLA